MASIGNELDIDAGLEQILAAIDSMENLLSTQLPTALDVMIDTANESGVPQLQRSINAFRETTASLRDSLKDFLGERGDTLSGEGSLYSAFGYIKKAQETLG